MTEEQEDDVLRVLHTADWHLGMDFPRFDSAQRLALKRARNETVSNVFLTARRCAVDAVLCAGDLFDDPHPSESVWGALVDTLRKEPEGRPIFLLPGNHDPLTNESIWRVAKFRAALPAWVHVVDHEPFEYALGDAGVLFAVPCCSKAGQSDPTARIPVRPQGDHRIRIGMVHGSTFDLPGTLTDFPIAKDAALNLDLDYLAIGDTHGFRFVPHDRLVPPTIYPGTPEPTSFEETLPGNVAVVGFNARRQARVDPVRVGRWSWQRVVVKDMRELRALARRGDLASHVLHLVVELRLQRAAFDEAVAILADLAGDDTRKGAVGVLRLERQGLLLDASDPADWAEFAEPIRAAAERLQALAAQPAMREKAQRAIEHLYDVARRAR